MPSHHGQHTHLYVKSRQFRPQLLKSNLLPAIKRNVNGFDIKYSRPFRQDNIQLISKRSKTICKQHSKIRCSVVSLKELYADKTLSIDDIAGTLRHYSTCQNVEFNSGETSKRHTSRNVSITNGAKNNVNRDGSFVASVEKRRRSYAEMIADYDEALYRRSSVTSKPNDNSYLDDTIRQSPFGVTSTPLREKIANKIGDNSEVTAVERKSQPPLPADARESCDRYRQHDDVRDIERHDFPRQQHETANKIDDRRRQQQQQAAKVATIDSQSENRAYAKLVVASGKSVHGISLASASNDGVLAPRSNALTRNFLESFVTPIRNASSTNTREMSRGTNPSAVAAAPAIEKRIARKVIDKCDKTDKSEKRKGDLNSQKYNYSQLSRDEASRYSPRYFGGTRKKTSNLSARKTSTQMSTRSDRIGALKASQVELRMVPSERESVVSIDVDSVATAPLDPPNSAAKQISIVVRSDEKRDPQSRAESQWSAPLRPPRSTAASTSRRNDVFGPMRISISEDSAPVKQIEFSINGKPVSELRSVTARAERLDVVSSMDQIEIRIPYDKDGYDLTRTAEYTSTEQILNVQISANFQNAPTRESPERSYKAETANTIPPVSPTRTPKTHYVFKDSARVSDTSFGSNDIHRQYRSSDRMAIGSDNTNTERNLNEHKTAKKLSTDEATMDVSSIERTDDLKIKRVNAKPMTSTTRFPKMNNYDENETYDPRSPSKVVPWWSSSDCFRNIQKKEDDCKPITPSNLKRKKAIANSKQNLTAESFSLKLKRKSSLSKTLTRNAQSVNDAIVDKTDINNSSNMYSCSNSSEQRAESQPTVRSSSLFKSKQNREHPNSISEIMENNSKSENRQTTSATLKGDKRISEVKRANAQASECDVSVEFDTRVGKISASPSNAQDLLSKSNREKKHDYPLKQAKSNDETVTTKPKVENILYAIKPIEKREDGILIDYGLKVPSRKPPVKLNSGVKIKQNPLPTTTKKTLASGKSMAEAIVKTKRTDDDTLNEKKDRLMKSTVTPKQARKSDSETLSSTSNFNDSSKLKTQMKTKGEESTGEIIVLRDNSGQRLKSLSEFSKDKSSSLSNVEASSGVIRESEKLGASVKALPVELKQNESQGLNRNTPGTEIPKSERLNSSQSLSGKVFEHNQYLSKVSRNKEMVDSKRSPLETINEIYIKSGSTDKLSSSQAKSLNIALKIEDPAVLKDAAKAKDAAVKSIADKSADKLDKKAGAENVTVKNATRNFTSQSPLPKDRETNRTREPKAGKDEGNSSGSVDPSRKPKNSASSTSSGSKTRVKSAIKSYDSENAGKSLFMESSCANFDRMDNTLSNSRLIVFKTSRNPNNIDDMLKNRALSVTGSAGPRMDRPEKSIMYSVWLQRFNNDLNEELS